MGAWGGDTSAWQDAQEAVHTSMQGLDVDCMVVAQHLLMAQRWMGTHVCNLSNAKGN
jgi:hypothetical protein